jgi:hypothetical protein
MPKVYNQKQDTWNKDSPHVRTKDVTLYLNNRLSDLIQDALRLLIGDDQVPLRIHLGTRLRYKPRSGFP